MKYKISIFLSLSFSLFGMDAPDASQTVPVKFHDFHTKEQRKFKKYDLAHPEKFLQLMREKFNYEENKEGYLKKLQTLGSGLLAQHQAMQYFGENLFFLNYYYQLYEKYNTLLRKLNSEVNSQALSIRQLSAIDLNPDTSEQLNIILTHNDLLKKLQPYCPEEISIFFSWVLDTPKGVWLNNLGLLQKTRQEAMLEVNNANSIRPKAEYSIVSASGTPFETNNPFIKENLMYAVQILYNAYNARSEGTEKANKTFDQTMTALIQLYRIQQNEYQLLYGIVKKELFSKYREAISTGQKIPATILLPVPEELRKQNHIPSKFPDELETIKNPATYLSHANLDAELGKARIEWDMSHATKPKVKKKIRRRKYLPSEPKGAELNVEEEIEAVEAIEGVKKIKIGPDGSYIAGGAEDDLKIIIEDPVHDATVTIFKTKSSLENTAKIKALPKINYTHWVNEWFSNPENAILTHGYHDPKNVRYRAGEPEWKPIVLHAFPQLVDEYIYKYSTVSQSPSRKIKGKNDILVTIPGKMEYPNGDEETGIFTYLIDPVDGRWFHRMFTPSSHKKMAADFMEKGFFSPEVAGYYDVYFPPLSKP
ncbi:hypothetical protein BH09DEP1_BH09DEP1_4550 [soil metagenome]